jgi:hypothetical protein
MLQSETIISGIASHQTNNATQGGVFAMTQVTEVKRKWSEAARLIDDARIPWDKIRDLSGQTSSLGLELMETHSAGLSDLAIKVQWLAEQDLDIETSKRSLHWVLEDIQRLQRQ